MSAMPTDLLLAPRDLTEDHFRPEHPVHETGDVYCWLNHFFGSRESAVNEAYQRIDDWLTARGVNAEVELDSHGTETDESYEARLHTDRHRSPTMSLAIWREAVLQIRPAV